MSEGYELDGTYHIAAAKAKELRQRTIPWEEQEAFFLRHMDKWGDLADMGMVRAMLGERKFKDNVFWYPHGVLQTMFEEEVADAVLYHIVLTHRREVIGDFADELGDSPDDSWDEHYEEW